MKQPCRRASICQQSIYTDRVRQRPNREGVLGHNIQPGKVQHDHKVTVQSDHKHLKIIVRKPLQNASKRLQRMMLCIQKYDLEVVYVPERNMMLADTSSRACLSECSSVGSVVAEIETMKIVQHLPILTDRLHMIHSATEHDKSLQTLIKAMQQAWPKDNDTWGNQATLLINME